MTDTQDDMELVELMLDRGDDVGVLGAFEALKASADRRVEEEREAIAKLAEQFARDIPTFGAIPADPVLAAIGAARELASAIRSRSNATGEDKDGPDDKFWGSDRHLSAQRKERDDAQLHDQLWQLREIIKAVRIAANSGVLADFAGEPWLRRIQNIDLDHPSPVQTGAVGSVPEGWKLVPVEPTDEMLGAAQERLCEIANFTNFDDYNQAEMFKAMLGASPSPPALEGVGGGLADIVRRFILWDDRPAGQEHLDEFESIKRDAQRTLAELTRSPQTVGGGE